MQIRIHNTEIIYFFVYFQDHEKTPYPKYAEYEVVPGEKVGQTVEK